MGHYIRSMQQLAKQFTTSNYRSPKRQRLYLKDIDTPDEWAKSLKSFIPEAFFYLNECIESRTGGDGSILEPNEYGQMRYGKGVAPAGDLMSSLPPEMRAQNMMCYIGHEGTYTPAHREMCASLGQNIMVEASKSGRGEQEGSSIWFMTETKEREVVSEYFISMLGHDIEVEKHFAQINAWKKAPFNVWVVEQKIGDLILIPPLAPHQVWNRGTRTMKAAWNRTTIDTLELAIHEALPRARLVCRDEQYKNKAIIYYTLIKYYDQFQRDTVEPKMWKYPGRVKQLLEDFKRLFALYGEILVGEMFSNQLPSEKEVEFLQYDSNVTCSYCRCNIFNRFLTCKTCIEYGPNGEEDTYDICMECYAMGRSCACISNLSWVEQWKWSTLTQNYELWRQMLVQCEGSFDIQKSPQPLEIARKKFGSKPVAQVCQEQLKIRPWRDPKVPIELQLQSEDEPEVDDEGRVKKKSNKKRRSMKAQAGKTSACHVCFHQELNWKLAFCTTCNLAYCYGVLYRAFDLMPQQVMEDRDWSCPKCLGICSCGKCRKNPSQVGYAPKGTLLGHDTKKVADFRSVESLVDFSRTNLIWLRGENDDNPQESDRMKKLRERAEVEKAREDVIGENYLGDAEAPSAENQNGNHVEYDENMTDIDPQLLSLAASSISRVNGQDTYQGPYAPAAGLDSGNGFDNDRWLDEHHDPDMSGSGAASYPTKLLAPVAPMLDPDDPEYSLVGQNRMMGIGYYQQGTGADKILYDPPDAVTNQPSGNTQSSNPNFALSDLIPPVEEKKRKYNTGQTDEEFYVSKKQKHLLETKKRSSAAKNGFGSDDEDFTLKPKPASRQPRRSVPKPQTYVDPDENSIPITADDIVIPSAKKAGEEGNGSATKTKSRFARKSTSDKEKSTFVNQRRSLRANPDGTSPTTTPAPKKERKSLWLARKEAEEAGEEFHPEDHQDQPVVTPVIDINSDDESDNTNVSEDDDGSLFGDGHISVKSAAVDLDWEVSDINSKVQVATTKTPGKRRGRPAKIAGLAATKSHKSRGRPRKVISILDSDEEDEDMDDDEIEHAPSVSELNVVSGSEHGDAPAMPAPKRRGRPPKSLSAVSTPATAKGQGRASRIVANNARESVGSTASPTASHTPSLGTKTPKSLSRLATPVVVLNNMSHMMSATSMPSRKSSLAGDVGFGTYGTFNQDDDMEPHEDNFESALNFLDGKTDEPVRKSPVLSPSPSSPPATIVEKTPTVVRRDNIGYMTSPSPPPTRNGPTVVRPDDKYSALASPSPPPQVKKGPTVIRKSDDFPTYSPPKPKAPPARTGPTIVRLMSEDEEEDQASSSDSSSDASIPAVPPAAYASRGGRGGSIAPSRGGGMMARRGRGRPPANRS